MNKYGEELWMQLILCTGFSEQVDEKMAKEMGISAFIMKPIVIHDIANIIREVLDKKDWTQG